MEYKNTYSHVAIYILALFSCGHSDECFHPYSRGSNLYYNGTVAKTVYGNACLPWDIVQNISTFTFVDANFPGDGSVSGANNYCRDPHGKENKIYCYTMRPVLTMEDCSLPYCTDPSGEHVVTVDGEMMRCRFSPENGECDVDELYVCKDTYKVVNSRKKRNNCFELFCCTPKDCLDVDSQHYNGTWRHDFEGSVCKDWNSDLNGVYIEPLNMPERSLDDAMNFCRDPDLSGYPWCYIYRRGFRGRFSRTPCGIPTCNEYHSRHRYNHDCYEITDKDLKLHQTQDEKEICESDIGRIYLEETSEDYPGCGDCMCCQMKGCLIGNGSNYMGTWSRTKSGRKCKLWNMTSYSSSNELFPEKSVADAINYCRHTSDNVNVQLWCFTEDIYMIKENCDIPRCDDLTTSTIGVSRVQTVPPTEIVKTIVQYTENVSTFLNNRTSMEATEGITLRGASDFSTPPGSTASTKIITFDIILIFSMTHVV